MSTRNSVLATLPCHRESVRVTGGRRSKQNERPRRHRCPSCGAEFWVNVRGGKVNGVEKA